MTADPPKKRGCFRILLRLALYAIVLLLLAGVAAVAGGFLLYDEVTRPGVAGPEVNFDVPSGATGSEVAELLTGAGLIEHPLLFRAALRLDTPPLPLKHGAYVLHRGMSPRDIVDLFQEGPNRKLRPNEIPDELKMTIPEGLRITQIAELFGAPEAFLEAVENPKILSLLPPDLVSAEGFLLPSTYYFDAPPAPLDVAERMAESFAKAYARLLTEYPDAVGRNPLEVVIVASLVEEEARVHEERPLVAAVIYNRLERNQTLDFDSTLQYALNKYGQRLLDEDKEVDSPYNTYRNAGLPPGPISNPGEASLRAAMNPADVGYLYFVSNADGQSHTFSATLEEHNRAVARYREEMREQRRPE